MTTGWEQQEAALRQLRQRVPGYRDQAALQAEAARRWNCGDVKSYLEGLLSVLEDLKAGKTVLEVNRQVKDRACLRCRKMFKSLHVGNRICPTCSRQTVGQYVKEEVRQETYPQPRGGIKSS